MASEQVIVGISMLAVALLWYSNELVKRGNMLWGQAFQLFSFLFMIVDFTVMQEFLQAESFFDLQDLVFMSLFNIIWYVMWILLGLWFFDLILKFMTSLRKPHEAEKVERIGGIEHGAT